MTPTRYNCLAEEVAKLKPKTILEVGTHNGRSASIMLQEAVKHNPNVKYFGFDLFDEMCIFSVNFPRNSSNFVVIQISMRPPQQPQRIFPS